MAEPRNPWQHPPRPALNLPGARARVRSQQQIWNQPPMVPGLWDGPLPGDVCRTWVTALELLNGATVILAEFDTIGDLYIRETWCHNWVASLAAPPDVNIDISVNGSRVWRGTGMIHWGAFPLLLIVSPGHVVFTIEDRTQTDRIINAGCACWERSRPTVPDAAPNLPPWSVG